MKDKLIVIASIIAVAIGLFYQHRESEMGPIKAHVKHLQRPTVLHFYAKWCGPCQRMEPIIRNAEAQYRSSITFEHFDTDDYNATKWWRDKLGINSIPRLFFFDRNGNEISERGSMSEEDFNQELKKLLR